MALPLNTHDEWLEADGLGGYASGTPSGIRTRRYHALLLTAVTPPTGRFVLVNGLDAWLTTPRGNYALSSQLYEPGVVSPQGYERIESFRSEPWPAWRYRIEDNLQLDFELFVPHGHSAVVLTWRLAGDSSGCSLSVRPFLSGRDYHSLLEETAEYRFDPVLSGGVVTWRPVRGLPAISALANGEYIHEPQWYRNFLYEEERARGLNYSEDLASPGAFRWDMSGGEATLVLAAQGHEHIFAPQHTPADVVAGRLRAQEHRRRERFTHRLHKAADAYIVRRAAGMTIVAGYPWFTDWGRDTFIALRGLCIATGRLDDARSILLQWADAVSEGMLPNFFTDRGTPPEYNSVDASLWYVVAVHDYLAAARRAGSAPGQHDLAKLRRAIDAILTGYSTGTRYGIRMDTDGLLAAGAPGTQLTWMDAKVGDWVVTPRIGKPVEVQALWINALAIAAADDPKWEEPRQRARQSFEERFWNDARGCLFDVVDCDHHAGACDPTVRPNQIFAVGGLPYSLLEGERARRVVDLVEQQLWTPLGLRSLGPSEQGYRGRYEGGVADRDGAYHQGAVWPWLTGAFVDAWVKVRGGGEDIKREARSRFFAPLLAHLEQAGLGHISEIADGDPPHTPRGCPFQAWSVGEALRIDHDILGRHQTE